MFSMAGAKENHILIIANIEASLHTQLKGRSYKVYPNDMRVRISETDLYTYPDVIVVRGIPQFEDEERDTLLNPTLIIEVLSESTEGYDGGKKFEHYRHIPSLQEYVLIAQSYHEIEKFLSRMDPSGKKKKWTLFEESSLEQSMDLSSIQCSLNLSEVYDKVTC